MKKRLTLLFLTALAVFLLSITAFAAPTMLKSVDIVFELPKAGDPFDPSLKPTVLSFKSGDIDLLATGAGVLQAAGRAISAMTTTVRPASATASPTA